MLPAEIVAALLDVVVRRDESQAIVISRKDIQAQTIRTGAKHAPWQIFQIEYDYNFSRYTTSGDHSLVLRGTGRVGDARLSFIANSSVGTPFTSSRANLLGGTVRLDRPNGQSFVGGEFGTGTDLEFLSAAVRGGLVQLPFHRVRLDFFGGQATSGIFDSPPKPDDVESMSPFSPLAVRYDTKIFGALATTASYGPRQPDFTFSAGAMHFGRSNRKGNTLAGGVKYMSGLNRFEADVAAGQFSGINRDGTKTNGSDIAINLTGSYRLTDQAAHARPLCLRWSNFPGPAKRTTPTYQPHGGRTELATETMGYGSSQCQLCNHTRKAGPIQSLHNCDGESRAGQRNAVALYLSHAERYGTTAKLCVHVDYGDEEIPSLADVCQRLAHQDIRRYRSQRARRWEYQDQRI